MVVQVSWLDEVAYTASTDRIGHTFLIGTPGIIGPDALEVSSSGGVNVTVAAGKVLVPVTLAPNTGYYAFYNDAAANLSLTSAPGAGTSRIDLIVARVYDNSLDGSTQNTGILEVVTGTAGASPTPPSTPNSSYVLAESLMDSAGTVTLTDKRSLAQSEVGVVKTDEGFRQVGPAAEAPAAGELPDNSVYLGY